jgi:hypothetical protein
VALTLSVGALVEGEGEGALLALAQPLALGEALPELLLQALPLWLRTTLLLAHWLPCTLGELATLGLPLDAPVALKKGLLLPLAVPLPSALPEAERQPLALPVPSQVGELLLVREAEAVAQGEAEAG